MIEIESEKKVKTKQTKTNQPLFPTARHQQHQPTSEPNMKENPQRLEKIEYEKLPSTTISSSIC